MKKEEAIAILQESRRQEKCMIDNYATFFTTKNTTDGVHNARKRYIALDMAISAMQKPVKLDRSRWEGCEYCGDPQPYCDCVFSDGTERILCSKGESLIDGFHVNVREIKFCPMCGKPLIEEAWKQLEQRIGENDGKID